MRLDDGGVVVISRADKYSDECEEIGFDYRCDDVVSLVCDGVGDEKVEFVMGVDGGEYYGRVDVIFRVGGEVKRFETGIAEFKELFLNSFSADRVDCLVGSDGMELGIGYGYLYTLIGDSFNWRVEISEAYRCDLYRFIMGEEFFYSEGSDVFCKWMSLNMHVGEDGRSYYFIDVLIVSDNIYEFEVDLKMFRDFIKGKVIKDFDDTENLYRFIFYKMRDRSVLKIIDSEGGMPFITLSEGARVELAKWLDVYIAFNELV